MKNYPDWGPMRPMSEAPTNPGDEILAWIGVDFVVLCRSGSTPGKRWMDRHGNSFEPSGWWPLPSREVLQPSSFASGAAGEGVRPKEASAR
jgi:hypothetical protein